MSLKAFKECRIHVTDRCIGRADDITKVKGVLLAPIVIEKVVRGFPELADEYEVIVTKNGDIDDILLKIEIAPDNEEQRWQIV